LLSVRPAKGIRSSKDCAIAEPLEKGKAHRPPSENRKTPFRNSFRSLITLTFDKKCLFICLTFGRKQRFNSLSFDESGGMKSLYYFMEQRNLSRGIRCSLENFGQTQRERESIDIVPLYAISNFS